MSSAYDLSSSSEHPADGTSESIRSPGVEDSYGRDMKSQPSHLILLSVKTANSTLSNLLSMKGHPRDTTVFCKACYHKWQAPVHH